MVEKTKESIKEKIKEESKEMLDRFAKALEKVENEFDYDFFVEREKFEREEGGCEEYEANFKKMMLENSPKHDDNFVIVERKSW